MKTSVHTKTSQQLTVENLPLFFTFSHLSFFSNSVRLNDVDDGVQSLKHIWLRTKERPKQKVGFQHKKSWENVPRFVISWYFLAVFRRFSI